MNRFAQIVIAILCVAITVAILFPVFATAKIGGKDACLMNIKQSALSLLMYADSFDDRLPNRDRWVDAALPYSKNEAIYHCPEFLKQKNPSLYGYAFNSVLSGRKTPEKPDAVPMVYDSVNLARNASDPVTSLPDPPRHNNLKNHMAYADGHAKSLYKKP